MAREIVMSGPGKNALGTQMLDHLVGEIEAAQGQPVLITGAGDAFSAGLNLRELAAMDAPAMERFLVKLDRFMARLFDYPAPTVALLNGHAIAGGCVLALCCDLRVAAAAPAFKIGLNETALGVRFPPGILEVIRRRVPLHALHQVVLGAGLYDQQAALRLGLVDEVSEDAPAAARRHLDRLAAHPPTVYAANKRDLRAGATDVPAAVMRRFLDEAVPVWTAPELKERLLAVLAR